MPLKSALRSRPLIYEVVPPRRDPSRFGTELGALEGVLSEPRIAAVNVPELVNRREGKGGVRYSPATIPPEEYALLIRGRKEVAVNMIAPRLAEGELLRRASKVVDDYKVENLVIVGKERGGDVLPGPGATEALGLVRGRFGGSVCLGGICIFERPSEPGRVMAKRKAGCDFVTSQIVLDPGPALKFLASYGRLCERDRTEPLTVFVSVAPVPTPGILSLLEKLDVAVPSNVRGRLLGSGKMGEESIEVASEVIRSIVDGSERMGLDVPLGFQIDQVGVHSDRLGLELLDLVSSVVS